VPTREVARRQRRPATWCLNPDGRRDRDECAKPIAGRGTGPAVDPVAVFSLVRFQEKEMIESKKGLKRMHGIKGIGLGLWGITR